MQLLRRLKNSGQVPNALTWTRIILFWVPAAMIVVNPHSTTLRWWAVAAFAAIVATDKLDGILARRWEQITKLGQIIDPLADKLLVLALVAALCWTNILVSPWGWAFLGINIVREGGVTLLRYLSNKGESNLIIPANDDGKSKMFLQSAGIAAALIPVSTPWWQLVIWVPLCVSLFYSMRSGVAYLRAE